MQELKFAPGRICATPGALELLNQTGDCELAIRLLLQKHLSGDWGELCPEDVEANNQSLVEGLRVLSNYAVAFGHVWIITEADRSVTTLLLPEEY